MSHVDTNIVIACPNCGHTTDVEPARADGSVRCDRWGAIMISTGDYYSEWSEMSKDQRYRKYNKLLRDWNFANDYFTTLGRSRWVSFVDILLDISLIIGLLGAYLLANYVYKTIEYAGSDTVAIAAAIGVFIACLLISCISIAGGKILIEIARDIRVIRDKMMNDD